MEGADEGEGGTTEDMDQPSPDNGVEGMGEGDVEEGRVGDAMSGGCDNENELGLHSDSDRAKCVGCGTALSVLSAVLCQRCEARRARRRRRRHKRKLRDVSEAQGETEIGEEAVSDDDDHGGPEKGVIEVEVQLDRPPEPNAGESRPPTVEESTEPVIENDSTRVDEAIKAARVLTTSADLRQKEGRLEVAVGLYENAHTMLEEVLGPNDPQAARTLHSLAIARVKLGQIAGAVGLLEKAVTVMRDKAGERDHSTVAAVGDLASVLFQHGQHDSSTPFSHHLPMTHASVCITFLLKLLSRVLFPSGAAELYEEVLGVREKELGPNHPNTGTTLSNLASVRLCQRRFDIAAALFERALGIQERDLGRNHPGLLLSLYNLAIARLELGEVDAAGIVFEKALSLIESERHGSVVVKGEQLASILISLGHVRQAQGRLDAAERLYRKGVVTGQLELVPDHPTTMVARTKLSNLLEELGRGGEATVVMEGGEVMLLEEPVPPAAEQRSGRGSGGGRSKRRGRGRGKR